MSRGLGALQREIKAVLDRAADIGISPVLFSDLREFYAIDNNGGDKLSESRERSLKRALKGLVDRGDVLIFAGKGGPGDPHRYITVERFAAVATGEVQDTAAAKRVFAELASKVEEFSGFRRDQ